MIARLKRQGRAITRMQFADAAHKREARAVPPIAAPVQGVAWTFDNKPAAWRVISAATPASMAASHFLGIEAIP